MTDLAGARRRVNDGATDDRPLEDAGAVDRSEEPLEETDEFDGVVGFSSQGAASLEPAEGPPRESSQVYICAPDGPSGSWAMGLEEDVRLLARAFAVGGIELCRELINDLPARSSARSKSPTKPKVDVRIALHGPDLDSSDEEELLDLIWAFVEKRTDGSVVRP